MRLNYLSLTNFRNYVRLELRLSDRLTVIQGANAQGKTNLLEAIHLLATGRSPRAGAERELINWLALESPLPYARLVGRDGERQGRPKAGAGARAGAQRQRRSARRSASRCASTARPNGRSTWSAACGWCCSCPKTSAWSPVRPAERRRYLDIALCQISSAYCRSLSEYNRVVTQRNALLKRLREQGGDPGQLSFWDTQMAEHGSHIVHQRVQIHPEPARRLPPNATAT